MGGVSKGVGRKKIFGEGVSIGREGIALDEQKKIISVTG